MFAWHCLAIMNFRWRITIGCGAKHVWELCALQRLAPQVPLAFLAVSISRTTPRLLDVHQSLCTYMQCGSAMCEEFTPVGEDGSGKGGLDVREDVERIDRSRAQRKSNPFLRISSFEDFPFQ
jgi:hypothetical protein